MKLVIDGIDRWNTNYETVLLLDYIYHGFHLKGNIKISIDDTKITKECLKKWLKEKRIDCIKPNNVIPFKKKS